MATMMPRRDFLRIAGGAGAAASVLGPRVSWAGSESRPARRQSDFPWLEWSIVELRGAMAAGELTCLELTRRYIDRIATVDWAGPRINSVLELNPDAEQIARELDAEEQNGVVRGPLHGIPVLLKDCIATADGMQTTAGSLALVGARSPEDAHAAANLRRAGALLLGKANMSEWNAFRGWPLHGGWCGRAGIGLNPYALSFSTGDSSSGSAAAVSANLAAGAVGLETYGSIIMPSSLCGVVGLKPTRGLVDRSGTIPISFSRDELGPIGRSVSDVAVILQGLTFDDPSRRAGQPASVDYLSHLDRNGLRGARIGVWRKHDVWKDPGSAAIEKLLPVLEAMGAHIVDDVELPDWIEATGHHITVMFREFRTGINRYLAALENSPVHTLGEVIEFNRDHKEQELRWHKHNILSDANEQPPLSAPGYHKALVQSEKLGRQAILTPMRRHRLDAIVCPTFVRPWEINMLDGDPVVGNGAAGPANAAGFPHITVPAGFVDGLPVGVSFMGRAWEESKLLKFGYALEQRLQARRTPGFVDTNPAANFVPR